MPPKKGDKPKEKKPAVDKVSLPASQPARTGVQREKSCDEMLTHWGVLAAAAAAQQTFGMKNVRLISLGRLRTS